MNLTDQQIEWYHEDHEDCARSGMVEKYRDFTVIINGRTYMADMTTISDDYTTYIVTLEVNDDMNLLPDELWQYIEGYDIKEVEKFITFNLNEPYNSYEDNMDDFDINYNTVNEEEVYKLFRF